jgi:integrase
MRDGAANGTVNGSLALLRRMLSIAHEDGKIQFRPKIRLLRVRPARRASSRANSSRRSSLTFETDEAAYHTFLYFCGVRLGEALQIEWSQVDLAGGLIRLESEQTKNSEYRERCLYQTF